MSDAKNIIETFHDMAQDVLVPRLKALEVEMSALRIETRLTSEAIREEMKLNSELLRQEIRLRYEALDKTIRLGDEKNAIAIQNLGEKFDISQEFRERLAALEARQPRQ